MAAPMSRLNFPKFSRFLRIFEPSAGFSPIYLTCAGTLHNGAVAHRIKKPPNRLVHLGTRCSSQKSDDGDTTSDVGLLARPKNRKTERKKFNELQKSHLPEDKKQDLAEDVMNAASAVGKLTHNPEETMNDLLSRLQSHPSSDARPVEENVGPQASLGDLLSSMNLEGVDHPPSAVRSSTVIDMEELPRRDAAGGGKLYTGQRLNIFSADIMEQTKKPSLTPLMDKLAQERMELFARLPPANAFEEMIRWTEDGKMWKFPIDNEQGLDEEKAVPFTEHVFLEHLIEDFPKKGPIRHFMELVVVGLSKNPYISVQEKHEQIQWFRDYFKDKMHLVELVEEQKQTSIEGQ